MLSASCVRNSQTYGEPEKAKQNCDARLSVMPLIEPEHLARLAIGIGTVFTNYGNKKSGSPAAFPETVFSKLCSLTGEAGARSLSLSGKNAISPRDPASLLDVDTAQDLMRISL